jgi:hypothetical protein
MSNVRKWSEQKVDLQINENVEMRVLRTEDAVEPG